MSHLKGNVSGLSPGSQSHSKPSQRPSVTEGCLRPGDQSQRRKTRQGRRTWRGDNRHSLMGFAHAEKLKIKQINRNC